MNQPDSVTSVRPAAAVCNVTLPVVRRWLSLGLIPAPPADPKDPSSAFRTARPEHWLILS
jgi:hypothetical protein